jgi:hypothetical protein
MNLRARTTEYLEQHQARLQLAVREATDELYRDSTPEDAKPGLHEEIDLIYSDLVSIRAELARREMARKIGIEQLGLPGVE